MIKIGFLIHIHPVYSYIWIDALKNICHRLPLRDTGKSYEDVYENSKYFCLYSVVNQ